MALRVAICALGLPWLEAPHCAVANGAAWDAGPFASCLYDVHGVMRWRAAGPFFERASDASGHRLMAVRPLFARTKGLPSEWARWEVLWPAAAGKQFQHEVSWRVVLAWHQDFDTTDPRSRWRLWVVPLYFQGRDVEGRSYVAVFPLGGRIREFLMFDEVDFALFPLWARTKKKETRSTSLLWPMFARTQGPGVSRIRVFPFYGHSMLQDREESRFILWPIYTETRYLLPASSGRGFVLWPFYGRTRRTDQRSDFLLPPLFEYTRSPRQHRINAPWPFVRIGWGETRRFYLWPLYGYQRRTGTEKEFVGWPIFWRERTDRPNAVFRRWAAIPFLQIERETTRRAAPGTDPVRSRYLRAWPLFVHEQRGAESRWRAPVLLPFRDPPPIERNWAPLWTLFERTSRDGRTDTELLWGVFRRQYRGAEGVRTSVFPLIEWGRRPPPEGDGPAQSYGSLLKGLIGWESTGAQRRLRMLYVFRFSWNSEAVTP